MNTKLFIDEKNRLREITETGKIASKPLLLAARIISYIFHPVFVPVYIVLFMLFAHPFLYAGFPVKIKLFRLANAFLMYAFFPFFTVFLLKALDFIRTWYLETQRERVIPIVASMIWYFWVWNVWRNLDDTPPAAVIFTLSVFISSILALFGNIIMKISLHAIAAGVMVCFFLVLSMTQSANLNLYLILSILIAGIVCTARLVLPGHSPREVYSGFFAGIISVLAAFYFG